MKDKKTFDNVEVISMIHESLMRNGHITIDDDVDIEFTNSGNQSMMSKFGFPDETGIEVTFRNTKEE